MYQPILNLAALDANQRAELVRQSALFDEAWYRAQYPEIAYHSDGNPDPAYHYANYGFKECQPSVLFDGKRYLKEQSLSEVNPLLHCLSTSMSSRPYRVRGAIEQVLAQHALGLPLTRSERLLLAEHSYGPMSSDSMVDLCVPQQSLALQLYVKAALNPTPLPQGSALVAYLREHGVSPEFIAEPLKTIPTAQLKVVGEEGLNPATAALGWKLLPQSLRVSDSCLHQHQLLIPNRAKHQSSEILNFVADLERLARNAQAEQPFNSDYPDERELLIYGPNDPIVAATLEAIKNQSTLTLNQLDFWCARGQVLCALSHQSPAITIFDSQGKMLPYAISIEPGRMRAINAQHPTIARFDELAAAALQAADGSEFMAVSFAVVPQVDIHLITHLSALPFGGHFAFTQGFEVHLAQRAQLTL